MTHSTGQGFTIKQQLGLIHYCNAVIQENVTQVKSVYTLNLSISCLFVNHLMSIFTVVVVSDCRYSVNLTQDTQTCGHVSVSVFCSFISSKLDKPEVT